ncbi:hypothetical protein BSK64_18435 [Paenibacillus odorifer]|uniref:lipopolysaccharide biosynthesis protein n=1 Tax=Paenibacillus odorifer TaxID=189426 RepID=UPI00096DE677|nr:hypothetical protein [Paenibacillus odorifer]OMD74809.1 hypothetical protein BSK50_21060 [Paenibacillus odorifer]OME03145.1 hypothetical protein BSK64_18435 [Paenibacillus odorifer]
MKLLKDILKVFNSNVLMLVSNIILNILLPLTLSISEYGYYRKYIMYITYVAIFNLGFIDGIYIKYGGENLGTKKTSLKIERNFLAKFQLIVSITMILVSLFINDVILLLLSVSIIPINLGGFHKILYQATGQFSKYARINVVYTIINFLLISFLLVFNVGNSLYYIISSLIAYIVILFLMEYDFAKFTKNEEKNDLIKPYKYFKVGIFILLGNIAVLLFTNMGAWLVSLFFSIEEFAQFSFATAMLNMVLVAISAVGLTFYNFLAKNEDHEIINFTKTVLIVLGMISGVTFFVLEMFIEKYLPHYSASLSIISISFVNLPYIMIINVIILNLYKARKQEKRFFGIVFLMLGISFALNFTSYFLFHSLEWIALSTTLSYIIWYFISVNIDFRFMRGTLKEVLLLFVHCSIFLYSANSLNWINGMFIYVVFCFFALILLYKRELTRIWKQASNLFKR